MAISPYMLWGSTSVVTVGQPVGGSAFQPVRTAAQLAHVSYNRPETWAFYFTGRLLGGKADPLAALVVVAIFDLVVGLGRAGHDTGTKSPNPLGVYEGFGRFKWTLGLGIEPGTQDNNNKFTTIVKGPPLNDDVADDVLLIDRVVAQEIQCTCRIALIVGSPTTTVTVEVGAFFAPLGAGNK